MPHYTPPPPGDGGAFAARTEVGDKMENKRNSDMPIQVARGENGEESVGLVWD